MHQPEYRKRLTSASIFLFFPMSPLIREVYPGISPGSICQFMRCQKDVIASGRTFDHVAHQILGITSDIEEFKTGTKNKLLESLMGRKSNTMAVFPQLLTQRNIWLNIPCEYCQYYCQYSCIWYRDKGEVTAASYYHNYDIHDWA